MDYSQKKRSDSDRPFSIWIGLECSLNRVGDTFFNQCDRSGHSKRIQDLKTFADLRAQKIRYPFLWELANSRDHQNFQWTWADERMAELKSLGLQPIVGFLHHGSGPKFTNLLDPDFPQKLTHYAKAFAKRYPEQIDYTPINEPLTTALLSCVYGLWYPHHRSDHSFLRALLNQVKATVLAMNAIREVQPEARLIQTESLGQVMGTSLVQSQVHFENERRWLSFDLLEGCVDSHHPLFSYLTTHGIDPTELSEIQEKTCGVDVMGINHELSSDRFLDHRIQYYPEAFHCGNGHYQYADVAAVDTTAAESLNPADLFEEVWKRYKKPLAVTEAHLNGPREDQMRWLHEIRQALCEVQARGAKVEAMTAGSLLGSFDWNLHRVERKSDYECGIFDLRGPQPRATALAQQIKGWCSGKEFIHPVLKEAGWWRDPSRKIFGPPTLKVTSHQEQRTLEKWRSSPHLIEVGHSEKTLLVIGCRGTLAQAFAKICAIRKLPVLCLGRDSLNICSSATLQKKMRSIRPWAIINTAGFSQVDEAEKNKENCYNLNVIGVKNLAEIARSLQVPLVHFSTDLVFDGSSEEAYLESDVVSPLCFYGETKAASEKLVQGIHDKSLVVRTSPFFGPWDKTNFAYSVIQRVLAGDQIFAPKDVFISPTYVPHLVHATLDLLLDEMTGVIHLTNRGEISWAHWAQRIADKWNRAHLVTAVTSEEMSYKAKRPHFSVLESERVSMMPSFDEAFENFFAEMKTPILHWQSNQEARL